MTQLIPRKAIGSIRRLPTAVLAAAVLAIATLAFVFGYDLWRFLISAFLVVTMAALVVLIGRMVPGTLRRDEK